MNYSDESPVAAWNKRDGIRSALKNNWLEFARYTIPQLFPSDSYNENTMLLPQNFQSEGALYVNNLTNAIVDVLLPYDRACFKLESKASLKADVASGALQGVGIRNESDLQLRYAKAEQDTIKEIQNSGLRQTWYSIIQALIVLGNCLIFFGKNKILYFNPRNYVVRRRLDGSVDELMICQPVQKASVDEELRDKIQTERTLSFSNVTFNDTDKLITWVTRKGNTYYVMEYLNDKKLLDKPKTYTLKTFPYLPQVWTRLPGANWGIGLVQPFRAAYETLEVLSRAIQEKSVALCKTIFLNRPGGSTKTADLKRAWNGDYVAGNVEDVTVLQPGEAHGLQEIIQYREDLKATLQSAFLYQPSLLFRDAERVTAAEINSRVNMFEAAFGGVYTNLEQMQRPIAEWLLKQINYKFDERDVQTVIVTGAASLSRAGKADQLRYLLSDLAGVVNLGEAALSFLKVPAILAAFTSGHGLDSDEFIKSEDEIMQEQQAMMEQQQAMMAMQQAQTEGVV